jgi:glutamate/tyrosine decarboxylase-like PLP-dependent enzyme
VDPRLARRTADLAVEYLRDIRERPVRERATLEELRTAFGVPLNDEPLEPQQVIEDLARAAEPGLIASQSPRYFGFVIGGALDAAVAADWLTSAWDQNGGGYPIGPSHAIAEETACGWLLDLLRLPTHSGVGLTTGCQMAHLTCLAAARHRVLADAGWDVEQYGLFGAPPVRVVLGENAHTTVFAALRMLGFGSRRVTLVPTDDQGRMRAAELHLTDEPTIVIAQVGEVNTGAIDPMPEITARAREHGAWCHVDGAFGLWAAASPKLRDRIEGTAGADSWATDAHKLLNVPYDCGIAIVKDAEAHRLAMDSLTGAAYIPPPEHDARQPAAWVPEFSRRARGFTVYAALRQLGRTGVAELVERCCENARLMAELLSAKGTILNDVALNQVLVRFDDTDAVIAAAQHDGTCWMSGTTWDGEPAMRISVCNWRTTADDIRRSADAILRHA